jgi:iron complex outermembrane receptor protein
MKVGRALSAFWPWLSAISAWYFIGATTAQAAVPTVSSPEEIGEIVVTAQKREQSVNDVGITIVTATGAELQQRGINSVYDLPRLVPGFTVQESAFNSTSFTLRGVGFFNSDLATPPAVSVYMDEAPIPYPIMTRLVAFDLERVEVLKGPQGTLYGQNATGGAINYIAAKPTDHLESGFDVGIGSFTTLELGGFVSGPLTEGLAARIAVKAVEGDPWQVSSTRPGDKLGATRQWQGRAIVAWKPTDRYRSTLSASAWIDRSETLAPQFYAAVPAVPGLQDPRLASQPVATGQRAADWNPELKLNQDSRYWALFWRNEFDIRDHMTLTGITDYSRYNTAYVQDFDGTPISIDQIDARGNIEAFSQELRLAGSTPQLNWLLGANYSKDHIVDSPNQTYGNASGAQTFRASGLRLGGSLATGDYHVSTRAVFGALDYDLTDSLSVQASARYNNDDRTYSGCNYSVPNSLDQGGGIAAAYNIIQAASNDGSPIVPIKPGQCIVLDPTNNYRPLAIVNRKLDEDNFSWKAGIDWKPVSNTLIYASISKGYKAGTFPVLGAAQASQYDPIPQESVLAYEVGLKAGLMERRAQLNLAAFYYDYDDKQLRGKIQVPIFGAIEGLVSIPKSRVQGFEAQVVLRPTTGMTLDSSVTYSDSEIRKFDGFDGAAVLGDQSGTPFPFSPKWQSVTDASYEIPISSHSKAYLGGTLTYNSSTNSGVGNSPLLYIKSYTLVDLRVGMRFQDGKYDVSFWGHNVTSEHYWTAAFLTFDNVVRFPARPTTYGLRLSCRL